MWRTPLGMCGLTSAKLTACATQPVGDLAVIDFRLTFGWFWSPGSWGVVSAAAEHAHCNTALNSTQVLDEGK